MLGVKFGQKEYVITILPEIEKEVLRSSRLMHNFPWFLNDKEFKRVFKSLSVRIVVSSPNQ